MANPLSPLPPKRMHPAVYITNWIICSSAVILYNKYILSTFGFRFPIFLVSVHLLFATLATRFLAAIGYINVKNSPLSWGEWRRGIVPIGLFFSGSLIFSNKAYIYLSVSFIQMLKAGTPIAVYLLSCSARIQRFESVSFSLVTLAVIGVVIASYGEIAFNMVGFIFQILGIMFEATRLVLIDKLMTKKMDPLTSLYYFAPVCLGFNTLICLFAEIPILTAADLAKVGLTHFFLNAVSSFALNVSLVYLIGCTSSLVLTLCGILKDIILVVVSMILFHTTTTLLQMFGYAISIVALFMYKTKDSLPYGKATAKVLEATFRTPRRRIVLIAMCIGIVMYLWISSWQSDVESLGRPRFGEDAAGVGSAAARAAAYAKKAAENSKLEAGG